MGTFTRERMGQVFCTAVHLLPVAHLATHARFMDDNNDTLGIISSFESEFNDPFVCLEDGIESA